MVSLALETAIDKLQLDFGVDLRLAAMLNAFRAELNVELEALSVVLQI